LDEESKQDQNPEASITTVQLKIFGKVQGVNYRSSLKNQAERFYITGWTRNLPDGSVEALLQGNEEKIQKVIEWCRVGPTSARVETVRVLRVRSDTPFRNFVVLR
jgi:acylphosphatase